MHYEKMTVKINNNPCKIKFALYEDKDANPQIHDIRKSLGHKLLHAIGVDHNSAGNSIRGYA